MSIASRRQRIFEPLTDPKQTVRGWRHNDRSQLSEFVMDPRVGGKWSTCGGSLRMGDVNVHREFLEIDPPNRLKYTLDFERDD